MLKLFFYLNCLLLLFFLGSCNNQTDSLESVKSFHRNDPYFKSALMSLHFMIETDPVEQVDTVFRQMIRQFELPVDAKGAADGIFIGRSPFDAFDYEHVVVLTIKNEKVVKIEYDEIHQNGVGKQYNTEYNEHMKQSGTTPYIAYPEYEKQLLSKQSMMEVDAVSGATYSLYRFRYAVTIALMQAKIAKTN